MEERVKLVRKGSFATLSIVKCLALCPACQPLYPLLNVWPCVRLVSLAIWHAWNSSIENEMSGPPSRHKDMTDPLSVIVYFLISCQSLWLTWSWSWAEDYKTDNRNQSQISSIWLAEMATTRHSSHSDPWDLRLVSSLSFIILGPRHRHYDIPGANSIHCDMLGPPHHTSAILSQVDICGPCPSYTLLLQQSN
jgi:hypothetical protein